MDNISLEGTGLKMINSLDILVQNISIVNNIAHNFGGGVVIM